MKTILFDLDGTLTDPAEGITRSVAYALEHFGIQIPDLSALYRFIGPPLLDSFKEFYGFTESESQEALRLYRNRFSTIGMFENTVYPGIADMLEDLKKQGIRLMLATSKPEEYAVPILQRFGLFKYIDFVAGNTLQESRPRKADVIRYAMECYQDISYESAIMVGDRRHDVEGARKCHLPCIGVLYGYGDETELHSAGADLTVRTVAELHTTLIGWSKE